MLFGGGGVSDYDCVRGGIGRHVLAGDLGGDDLADDVAVGEADDKTVFGCIVFVLGLCDEAFAGVVVGFTLATTLVFGLIAAGLQSAATSLGRCKMTERSGRRTYSRRYS